MNWQDKTQCRLDGKVAVVTGASAGIGKETARDLAQRGATVIMACRNLEKSQTVREEMLLNFPEILPDNLDIMLLDLSEKASIKKFAEELLQKYPRIFILINNAGVISNARTLTVDGFESDFGVNYLGHFYLTFLIKDAILAASSAPDIPRIVILSSVLHETAEIQFYDLQSENNFSIFSTYGHSKLANLFFAKSLAQKYGDRLRSYAVHPGVVHTGISNGFMSTYNWIFQSVSSAFGWLFFKTEEDGAQTSIYCAVSEECGSESGLYYADCKVKKSSDYSSNMEIAEKLWKVSCELLQISWDV